MTKLTNILLALIVVAAVPTGIKAYNDNARQSNCVEFLMGQLIGHEGDALVHHRALVKANAKCQRGDTNW